MTGKTKLPMTVFLLLLACRAARADQVMLKNGDRLTGTIVKSDGKTLLLKTDYAGDLKMQWKAIQGVRSSEELHITLTDGRTVAGVVTSSDGKLEVTSKSAGAVEVPIENVAIIRSFAEQAAYEESLHPGWLSAWSGGTSVGFALTRGNSQTRNFSLGLTGARETLHDKLGVYASSVYTTNDAPGAVPSTTASLVQGGVRYDRDLVGRWFAFVAADFMHNGQQNLDLRSVLGGGLGYHLIKSKPTTLDFLAGLNYTRENYSTFNRNFAALTVGEEFMHQLGASTVLTQNMYVFPDLNAAGEYRATFNFGTVTKISKWFGWQNSFVDIYVTNPPSDRKQNDIIFTTGLNVSFGGKSE